MNVTPPRRSAWRNLSPVWLVPLLALAVSLGIAWQSFADRGTLIQISFQNASGVVADETTIRYRDVVIGQVEDVSFTDDLTRVLVSARVENNVVPYLDADAIFWVVRPEVTTRGISGLSTVLSGVYIEGAWDDVPGTPLRDFVGDDAPPLVQPGRAGKRITLQTDDGTTITYGAPVLYRGIEVGRLETPRLSADGETVLVDAFIEAPHDAQLSEATRFWDASGFEFSLGTAGLSLDFDSLASLVSGGIAFDNLYEDGAPISPGHVFTLYEDETKARRNRLVQGPSRGVTFSILFDESVNGLEPGDEVSYQGLDVGEVTELRSRIVETPFGPELSLLVNVAIDPQRMGLPADAERDAVVAFFRAAIANGMRARLATESLLSSDLLVELVVLEEVEEARLVEEEGEAPRLPSVQSNLPNFTATAEGVLERINALPIEEVMEQAISLMDSIEDIARSDDLRAAPGAAVALIDETRALVAGEAMQGLPDELRAAVADVRAIVGDLRDEGAVDALSRALRSLDETMTDLRTASARAPDLAEDLAALTEEEIPALLADLRGLTEKADALEIENLVASAARTLDRIDALLARPETQALPGQAGALLDDTRALVGSEAVTRLPQDLRDALADARSLVDDLRAEGAVEALGRALRNFDRAMADVSTATEAAPQMSENLRRMTETDLPALLQDLQEVARKAEALDLQGLVDSASSTLARIDGLVGSTDTQELPATLNDALTEMRFALADLRQGGVVENLNDTLASASEAARSVAQATDGLPQLAARLERLVGETETVVRAYGERSDFNQETLDALREVRDAARAVSQLARAIERSPNSLIFGR